jgi:hypothetical protein
LSARLSGLRRKSFGSHKAASGAAGLVVLVLLGSLFLIVLFDLGYQVSRAAG